MSSMVGASVLIEYAWDFEEGDAEHEWCKANAAFQHKEACEFIIHIGTDTNERDSFYKNTVRAMKEAGCSTAFIQAYERAAELGAVRVLFFT